jgi:hypothetical protein
MKRVSGFPRSGRRVWVLLVLWPILASCTALQFTYSTADWILLWRMDRYFDLSADQRSYLNGQAKSLHRWHRRTQLPQYAQFVRNFEQRTRQRLTREDVERVLASVEQFRVQLAEQAAPPGANFLGSVTPRQVRHFQDQLAVEHRRLLSEIGMDQEARVRQRLATVSRTLTSWVGRLSSEQEHRIGQWIRDMPDLTDMWLEHRLSRQSALLELLDTSPNHSMLDQELFQWLAHANSGGSPGYLVASKKWREALKTLVVNIDGILTGEQRQHLSKELESLIRKLTKMAG